MDNIEHQKWRKIGQNSEISLFCLMHKKSVCLPQELEDSPLFKKKMVGLKVSGEKEFKAN